MQNFNKLVDDILEFMWKSMPVEATFAGIHKYDHELGKFDRDALTDINTKMKSYVDELEKIDTSTLTANERMDHTILSNTLKVQTKSFDEIRMWEKNPSTYVDNPLYGVFILAIREFAPLNERMESILARLEKIPKVIEEGKKNLKNSPAIYTQVAIESIQGGIQFFDKFIPLIAEKVPKLKDAIIKATNNAKDSFEAYGKFLENEWLPKSTGDFAIGKGLFDYKLKVEHILPYNSEDLLEIGDDLLHSTKVELEILAKEINPSKAWWEIIEELKNEHPKPANILDTYRKEMNRARQFVIEKNLVTIPTDEELDVIPTPEFERPIIPYAAYMPPAPFEEQQKGFFYVTPSDKKEQLRGHSIYKIPVTALHEGYPGHHLQFLHANRVDSKVRKLFGTSVFIEGWALYCEEMMYDLGYYRDPRVRLMQLKDRIWRACRVIIDVNLHTKRMTYGEAIDFLVKEAKLERPNAIAEVKRYTRSPTQPMSYAIGKKQIMSLKDEYKDGLKEFHDKLLSFGSIPVALIKERMIG